MIMALIALSLGVSILFVAKVVLSWVLSLSFFKIAQMRSYCCKRRNDYQQYARHQLLQTR
ncbi:MAG: hypothetical protein HON68_09435 [Gammaproteobacteria bacterium]|mgnify:FL=1|jgi:hypothetical protein|nr:hypothetical protein [Gammaproteobacteria bacterium]MBT3488305.1 hypothetical protein [Gammaproteobacteria bacterium]MBT3718405.1 hypothetical protein [Gammaproteobacteria bacterium]MBT3844844.1 hypothetical protein [Gammaproteobacteria bacterium]MBT3894348.1 hypothetical protein [Gammaproteobacteria bacterium]